MTRLRLLAALGSLLLMGCQNNDMPEEIASIFVEAPSSLGGAMKQEVRLPVSRVAIAILPQPLVQAEDILGTLPVTSGEPDLRQEFLLVQLDRRAAIDVMNYTKEAIGRHFVLIINETDILGILKIDIEVKARRGLDLTGALNQQADRAVDGVLPVAIIRPDVGCIVPASSLSNVLFPAPLRPMIPRVRPASTENETPSRAQNSSRCPNACPPWKRAKAAS